MITLQVGNKEVELPEKLSINQYLKMKNVEDFGKKPIEFLSALSGLDEKEIKYAKKKDMDFVFRFLTQKYFSEQDTNLKTIITIDNVEYGLMTDITQLNFGGWVDLEFLTTDGVEKNMSKIMAIMYRPIIEHKKNGKGYVLEEYDHDTMEDRAEIFLHQPVEYFWGVSSFFFRLVKELSVVMKNSSDYQQKKMIAKKRLKMLNPKYLLSKLYHVFTGRA